MEQKAPEALLPHEEQKAACVAPSWEPSWKCVLKSAWPVTPPSIPGFVSTSPPACTPAAAPLMCDSLRAP